MAHQKTKEKKSDTSLPITSSLDTTQTVANTMAQDEHMVSTNPTICLVSLLFQAGKRFGNGTFPPHTGYMNQLRLAYERKDQSLFLLVLEKYLHSARGVLPSTPRPEKIADILQEIERLFSIFGVPIIARVLLRGV